MLAVALHLITLRDSLVELTSVIEPGERYRHMERRYLARNVYRQIAQEIISASLTVRQARAQKYHDIFGED